MVNRQRSRFRGIERVDGTIGRFQAESDGPCRRHAADDRAGEWLAIRVLDHQFCRLAAVQVQVHIHRAGILGQVEILDGVFVDQRFVGVAGTDKVAVAAVVHHRHVLAILRVEGRQHVGVQVPAVQ